MELSSVLKGVVYSQFGEMGPEAYIWFPQDGTLDSAILGLVSLKSITILQGEEGQVPEDVAVVPFPKYRMNSIVSFFSLPDTEARGGERDATLCILFSDKFSSIIYKHLELFKEQMNTISKEIVKREMEGDLAGSTALIQEFHASLLENLRSLQEAEVEEPKKADFKYKVIVVGDPAVGKTTLLLRYVDNCFKEIYIPTVGVNVSTKQVDVGTSKGQNINVTLNLWDLAGQKSFLHLRRMYLEGANAAIIVYDSTRSETFQNIKSWFEEVNSVNPKILGYIIGNKIDLLKQRKVSTKQGKTVADDLGFKFLETSAKTGKNIPTLFKDISRSILTKYKAIGT
ncbi:MAG: Rab family GTPase [Candidatus Helarchaeota archaeon]